MPDATTFGLFVAAALALLLMPGPAVIYVVTRSVDQGRPAGLASVLGVGIGSLVHIAFAAVGLSALLASSAAAFGVVKWLGAAYLIWLGLQRLLTRGEDAPAAVEPDHLSRIFLQGVVVNVLNPKTALFFLAFLPQFVDP
jgi:threonine/homoserine/homoserine lactone efflux protein